MPFVINKKTPLLLCILDGFGYSESQQGNAIATTPTPTLDYLWSRYPSTLIKASQEEVGLDFGQPGNSEVGHLSIGTGRVLLQHLPRINLSISENSFFENPALLKAVEHVQKKGGKLHVMGMISTTGVHAHLSHILELIRFAKTKGIKQVYLHLITDGRDSGAQDSPIFLEKINQTISENNIGVIASIAGREFTMDRNNNWDKTQQSYDMMTGTGGSFYDQPALQLVQSYYQQNIDDEHIPPTLLNQEGVITDEDALIFTNFREDRARQITKALSSTQFSGFTRKKTLRDFLMVTMTEYEKGLPVEVAFPPESTQNCLSDVLETMGFTQFHLAESEKTAHVTYFFNGGRETTLPHEDHFTLKSPPPSEFEQHPEMSANQVTATALEAIEQDKYDVYIVNFANADMIGHTGNFAAAQQAIAVVEQQVNALSNAVLRKNGLFALTADHGNAELMIDPKSGQIYKEHTINPVPFIISHFPWHKADSPLVKVGSGAKPTGILSDVAPTLLHLCQLPLPQEMTGIPLFDL